MAPHPPLTDALEGLLLGTAVGDAIGLPFEGVFVPTPCVTG